MGLSVVVELDADCPTRGPRRRRRRSDRGRSSEDSSATPARTQYDGQQVQKTVEFWERREKKDPRGAIARRNLAGAYLAGQRETGRIEDAVLAERAARSSLELLPRSNAAALNKLATALLSQHRFAEALEVADRALALDPEAQRLRADILLELGEYQAARKALGQIPNREDDLNLMALRARFAEVEGKMDRSIELLKAARPDRRLASRYAGRGRRLVSHDGRAPTDRHRKTGRRRASLQGCPGDLSARLPGNDRSGRGRRIATRLASSGHLGPQRPSRLPHRTRKLLRSWVTPTPSWDGPRTRSSSTISSNNWRTRSPGSTTVIGPCSAQTKDAISTKL